MGAKCVFVVLAVALSTTGVAHAGDACPVSINVVDLGLPDWAKPTLKAKVAKGDSFLKSLVRVANAQDCNAVELSSPAAGSLGIKLYEKVPARKLTVAAIKGVLIDKKRRFQCDKAARKLKYLQPTASLDGMLLYYRGHRRILLVSPGWKSICVPSSKADKMSDKDIARIWQRVAGPLTDDRIANP